MSALLERDPEVQTIDDALAAAYGGDGRVVLVEAPAGLGKSTLLAAARDQARARGFEVLAARGRELEREFPFGVARQLFEARVRAAGAAERRRLLQGSAGARRRAARPRSARARPAAGRGLAVPAPPRPALAGRQPRRAHAARPRRRRRPLGRRALAAASSSTSPARLADLPIAIVVAHRPGLRAVDGPLLAQLAAEPAARVLRLAPLSEAAAAAAGRGARARAPSRASPPPATTRPAATRSCSPSS